MPWDNNTGGGNRNSGGPWGQAPGGGSGGGPRRGGTPNLEEILARGRDRFQGGVPGGRWAILGGVLVLIVLWLMNAVYTIDANQVGVKLRFGKPIELSSRAAFPSVAGRERRARQHHGKPDDHWVERGQPRQR